MIARFIAICAFLLAVFGLTGPALAADLTVMITDNRGRPVEDAVVILDAPGTAPRAGRFVINQHDEQFVPRVLVIPAGSTIEFGNLDPFRHHVYSFSPARRFELRLFGQGETRPVRFDNVGVVAIGCNIHDNMEAFIQVVDTPHAGKSGSNGRITLRNVPTGSFSLRVWHPRLRAPANQMTMQVNTATTQNVPVSVRLRGRAPSLHDY